MVNLLIFERVLLVNKRNSITRKHSIRKNCQSNSQELNEKIYDILLTNVLLPDDHVQRCLTLLFMSIILYMMPESKTIIVLIFLISLYFLFRLSLCLSVLKSSFEMEFSGVNFGYIQLFLDVLDYCGT